MSPTVIDFRLNEFASVSTHALAITSADDTVVLTIEAEPPQWETIDLLELFHLGLAHRHEGSVSGGAPVRIELRLDRSLAAERDALPSDLVAIAEAPEGSPLRDNSSWYALSVTEAVDLPPELANLGAVHSGFTTVWADQPQ